MYYRRERGDMIECYKITHDMYKLEPLLEPVKDNSRRGHSFKLMKHHTNKSVRSHVFSERVINNWNLLPEDVVAAQSINAFWHWNRLDWH